MRYETPLDGSLLLLQKVAHKKSSLASSLLDAESFEQAVHVLDLGNSNSLIYVLGPLTVGVLASAVLMEVFSWSKRFEVGLLGLRSLWLLLAVLATVDMSILIPISYDIAQQLGHGALASGILVAASQAFQPVLALVSRWLVIGKSYQYQRRFMLCCFGAEAVLTWLMVPVFEACNHWSNQTVLYALVFLRAMTGGVLMLYGVPLSTCVYDSSPLEDRSQLSIKFYLCLSIGVCVGPFVSSIMLTLHQGGAHDSCYTGRQSISVLGFVWAVVAVLATTFLPYELEDKKPLVETPQEAAESAQALSLAQAVQRIPTRVREALVWSAVLFSAERSFSIGAIEVATALLLEVEYSWTPEQIGYAQILVAVLEAHWRDQAIFKVVLKILTISCEQTQLCRCFFEAGLSSGLRRFLRKVRRGEVEECWFEDMKGRIGMSSKSLRKAKDAILARMRVTQAIREAEDGCWQMLQALAVNAGGGQQQAEQAHENYQKDTSKTIAQALHELRETPHGSQWPLAVKYLEAMLLYDFTGHAEFFQQQEGLTLTLAELPNGQVAAVHPLLVAVLRLHVRSIPTAPHYCPVADDQEEAVHRSDSYPRPMDLESKPMFPRLKQFSKRCSAPQLTIEGELVMHSDKVTNDAKATFAEAGAVKVLLESLLDVRDLDLQDGLLRILSDLVQDPALFAKEAAEEFKDFVLTDNGGADVVLELMKGNLKNKTRVNAALYTLAGVVTLIPDAASTMATELGSKVLIQTVWKYWSCGDTRRRSLMLLRRMRDAKPDLTAFMLKHWKASLAAMECGQSEDPDAATPEGTPEPVVEATPAQEEAGDERDGRDGNAVGDEGIGAVEEAEGAPEDQPEQAEMPLESCEMSQLDEETLEAVQPEEGRGPQTRESVTASPEPEAAPGNKLMTEAQLPREMRHFLALLKVHRFEQKSHILAIPDVVKAIVDFKDDPELSRLGMRALMSGTAMEQEMRLPTIGRCPNFVKSVRRIMHKESMQEVLQLQLRLVLGILDNDPSDYQDWVECAVFATVKVLQATAVWTTNSWEVILQAIEEAMCTPQGKILLQNFNVALSLYKEWEKLKDSHDDALAKMIVSSFHDQTERILEIIG